MSINSQSSGLTKGSLLARNSLVNIVGQIVPMTVALFTIPLLIKTLGPDRFGIVTLVWMVIGYFSLFDLGLGRALTQGVAERLGRSELRSISPFIWTALTLLSAMGVVGCCVIFALSKPLVLVALKIPVDLQMETLHTIWLLAASMPIVLITAALNGILAAYQRFVLLNYIRLPQGIYSYLAPLLVALFFSKSIFAIAIALVIGRAVFCLVSFFACLGVVPSLKKFDLCRAEIKPLFRFGGWMTVSNVFGPLMVYLDRFLIGGIISMAAVAYYATPYEVVTKLWIVPTAITSVMFPAFATSYRDNPEHSKILFLTATRYVGLALFPVTLLIMTFSFEGLSVWLSPDFARHSSVVLKVLALGVFINSMATVFFAYIQGVGRPDLTAKIHIVELPIYAVLLLTATKYFGIDGAALAWTARVIIDTLLMLFVSSKFLRDSKKIFYTVTFTIAFASLALVVPASFGGLVFRLVAFAVFFSGYIVMGWRVILSATDREVLTRKAFTIRERMRAAS